MNPRRDQSLRNTNTNKSNPQLVHPTDGRRPAMLAAAPYGQDCQAFLQPGATVSRRLQPVTRIEHIQRKLVAAKE